MSESIMQALITGISGIIGTVLGAIIGRLDFSKNKKQEKDDVYGDSMQSGSIFISTKNYRSMYLLKIQLAVIAFLVGIVIYITFGQLIPKENKIAMLNKEIDLLNLDENVKNRNIDFQKQIDELSKTNNDLSIENANLNNANHDLQSQIDKLTSISLEHDSLVEENAQLKVQISQLQDLLVLEKKNNETTDDNIEDKKENEIIYIEIIAANGAKIRSAPESSSVMVGGAERGKKLLLHDTVIDQYGIEWCEVLLLGGKKGYIRSDLTTIVE